MISRGLLDSLPNEVSCHLQKAESTASRDMPTITLTSENRMDIPTSVIP
jgi:hypothetical protein